MESMSYCLIENTTRILEELLERVEHQGKDLLEGLGPYEKPCYPKLIKLCKQIVELHEREGYQEVVDSWNEDPDVKSAYELMELIDSMEED